MSKSTYFNGHNASISVGPLLSEEESVEPFYRIADIVTLEYSESSQKVPIYGYKSVTPDTFLQGEYLIQGQFSIGMNSVESFNLILANTDTLDDTLYTYPILETGSPISRDSFTIEILYENPSFERADKELFILKKHSINYRLEEVSITGMQTIHSSNAEPIAEFYNFIAKRIAY